MAQTVYRGGVHEHKADDAEGDVQAGVESRRSDQAAPASSGRATHATEPGLHGLLGAVLAAAIAAVGGVIDIFTGQGLRTLFAVCLAVGVAIAAFAVRRRQVLYVAFAPPLICLGLAMLNVLTTSYSATGLTIDYLTRGFPAIAVATGVGFAIAAIRQLWR